MNDPNIATFNAIKEMPSGLSSGATIALITLKRNKTQRWLSLAGILGTKKDDDDDDDEIVNGISPTGRYREARPGNGNDYGN